jgi:4-hydroxy-2-oxoheptanedioate aldolase
MKMRRSRVLEKLRAGQIVSCLKINLDSSRVVELAAIQGFDCIWTDVEHTATEWATVERQVLSAKVHDADLMVRVQRGAYSEYSVPLELDAAGLLIPHVMNVEDAKNIVRMTRFHPLGLRALDGGNADGAFCNIDLPAYMQSANDQRFISIQIEDPEPLEQLEEIAALPGIDMLFFGPGDFSQAIGEPGNIGHPKVQAALKRVAEVANANGKFAATVSSPDTVQDKIALGYRFLSVGADVVGLNNYFADLLGRFTALENENPRESVASVYK